MIGEKILICQDLLVTNDLFQIQITSLCMCISLSGTVALCCFFAPKVYIVLCQPYKNVRNRQTTVGRLVNQQMRFIRYIFRFLIAIKTKFLLRKSQFASQNFF